MVESPVWQFVRGPWNTSLLPESITVTKIPKKDANACIDFIYTIMKGHLLAYVCEMFGVGSLDEPLPLPSGINKAPLSEKLALINKISHMVVEGCTLVEGSFTNEVTTAAENEDGIYNYARVLCHYGSLVMEFRDAWQEGDGERVLRCWKLFMPHFKVVGCTKYSLEALKLLIHTGITCSPNLAHQITWHRFVNTRGGAGNNIPCDLFNEHINKQIKHIIQNMGSNLTESALQRAARSVTSLHQICKRFDSESGVPITTTRHGSRSDIEDVRKVVKIVLKSKLLAELGQREHRSFREMKLNPLHKWDVKKTERWIERKIEEYKKFRADSEIEQLLMQEDNI